MRRIPWKRVCSALRADRPPVTPRARNEFWAAFRLQAHAIQQPEPVLQPVRSRTRQLAWAGSCVALALLVATPFILFQSPAHAATQVRSLEIAAPYSGVLIISVGEDACTGGTIIWVSDMEVADDAQGT